MKNIISKIKAMFDISFWDAVYKLWLFGDLLRITFPALQLRYVAATRRQQQQTIALLKQKERITVAFFLQSPTTWKYAKLYTLLARSARFRPVVVICPYNVHLNYSADECLRVMQYAETFAQQQGYDYISTYDSTNKKWINIRKKLNPDIVLFTKPYKDTHPNYYIYKFRDKITCYTSYGFICLNVYRLFYNLPSHNLLYHFFVETDFQKQFAQQYSLIKGENAVVTGFLGTEPLIDGHTPTSVWKPQPTPKKRIIWAPHHTLDYMFNFSNFLIYNELMIELAKKYEDSVQFVFKPHPVLKFKLINLWGAQKTEEYYNHWQQMPNTQIEESYYIDLFLTSDAMIHDCASFTAEYLYTLKPVCFTIRDEKMKQQWNPFGMQALDLHYHAHNAEEIERFIQGVVLGDNDPMYNERKTFYDNHLYPKDGIMPSEKIMKILETELSI
jgi:CDP-glycerol glycerophosphotransferase (TagB/SpsB family)